MDRRIKKVKSPLCSDAACTLHILTIFRHLKPSNTIRYCVYYGKDKTKFLKELGQYSLVITTYSVVRLDWKSTMTQPENTLTLHGVNWERVVLDEGAPVLRYDPMMC